MLAAQEELSALRAAHDAGRADRAVEEDEREARLAELEAELAELRRQTTAAEPPRPVETRAPEEPRLADLESELAALRQQLAGQEKRRLTLEAELAHVRAANEKLEAGLPVAPLPPAHPTHPELPLQLPPSRPLVVYTSRGL